MKSNSSLSNVALRRLDNAAVVQFLSQIGSVMVEFGLVDRSDVEEFRIMIQQTNSIGDDASSQSPLIRMVSQPSNLMSAISEHFGPIGFSRNLLRYSMRESSRQLNILLRELIALCVDQAGLMFNRPFALFLDQDCDRLTLFSTPLLEIGAACEASLGIVETAAKNISKLIPSDFPSDSANRQDIDQKIAKDLAFAIDPGSANSLATESLSSDLFFVSVRHVGKAVGAFAEQLRWNLASDHTGKLRLACDFLINQSLMSSTFRKSSSADLQTWEHKRQHWTEAFHQVLRGLDDIRLALRECLDSKTNIKIPEMAVLARNVGRMVSADLMRSGVNPVRAQQASRDLLNYCKNHKIRPSQVISGELGKINPSLSASSLKTLQSTDQNPSILIENVNEKSCNFRTMERLKSLLNNSLTIFLLIFSGWSLSFLLGACGLKADPRSQLQDPRPEIPFHPESSPTPQAGK